MSVQKSHKDVKKQNFEKEGEFRQDLESHLLNLEIWRTLLRAKKKRTSSKKNDRFTSCPVAFEIYPKIASGPHEGHF